MRGGRVDLCDVHQVCCYSPLSATAKPIEAWVFDQVSVLFVNVMNEKQVVRCDFLASIKKHGYVKQNNVERSNHEVPRWLKSLTIYYPEQVIMDRFSIGRTW